MASPVEDPDTQFVGELLWAELYPNEMQPAEFNWMPLPGSPADASAPADALAPADTPAANTINSSATPSRLSTPEVTPGLSVPLDLASWRQRLFEVSEGETMTLSSEQWTQYWPFVTNLWTKHAAPHATKRKRTVRTQWDCRFHKKNAQDSLGSGQRGKQIRIPTGCPARLIESHDPESDSRDYTMTGRHNHSITELDMTKINSGVGNWVEAQLLRGFSCTAIEKVAKGKGTGSTPQNLHDAGGRYLSVKYIRNTANRLKIRAATPRHVPGNVPAENQAREALEWLQARSEIWHSMILETSYKGSPSRGLVFARKETIEVLGQRGMLTLMDSTHKTNKAGW
jgi:hypothetical protein